MTTAQDPLLNVARANLAASAKAMSNALQAAERLRSHQLEAMRQALVETEALIAEIRDARSFDELIAVQVSLATAQFRNASSYWTGVHETVQATLADSIRRALAENESAFANIQDIQSLEEVIAIHLSTASARFQNEFHYWTTVPRSVPSHLSGLLPAGEDHSTASSAGVRLASMAPRHKSA